MNKRKYELHNEMGNKENVYKENMEKQKRI
jgi:hypothetical protein